VVGLSYVSVFVRLPMQCSSSLDTLSETMDRET
jgi:hypothetical protein